MIEQGDSSNRQKMNDCSFQHLLRQNLSWFCLSTGKPLVLEVPFYIRQQNFETGMLL